MDYVCIISPRLPAVDMSPEYPANGGQSLRGQRPRHVGTAAFCYNPVQLAGFPLLDHHIQSRIASSLGRYVNPNAFAALDPSNTVALFFCAFWNALTGLCLVGISPNTSCASTATSLPKNGPAATLYGSLPAAGVDSALPVANRPRAP